MKNLIGIFLLFLSFSLAQNQTPTQPATQLFVNGQALDSVVINGKNYAEAFALGRALGLDVRASRQDILLIQGGRIIDVPVSEVANANQEKIKINGKASFEGQALEQEQGIVLPVAAVAQAVGATFGDQQTLNLSPVRLNDVSSSSFAESDRVILQLSRDSNFVSKLVGNQLTISLSNATADNHSFSVSGRFISQVDVSQQGEVVDARINLPPGIGFRAFAAPAVGSQTSQIIIDLGPAFQRATATILPTIVIDAGHGGFDRGLSGGGLVEKELTLELAKRLTAQLKDAKARVVLTRQDDSSLDLDQRREASYQADVFISLHLAKLDNSSSTGAAIYSRSGSSQSSQLAKKMNDRLLALPFKLVSRNADVAVLDEAPKAALLIEFGWLSNKTDRQKLLDPAHLSQLSAAIAKGITDYLENR